MNEQEFIVRVKMIKAEIKKLGYILDIDYIEDWYSDNEASLFGADNHLSLRLIDPKNRKHIAHLSLSKYPFYSLMDSYQSLDDLYMELDCIDEPIGEATTKLFKMSDGEIALRSNILKKLGKCPDDIGVDYLYYIETIEVDPEYRKQGFGKLLLDTFFKIINIETNDYNESFDNLILCYPHPIHSKDYTYDNHRDIMEFWHKQKFCPLYNESPMFFYNNWNYKYNPKLADKLIKIKQQNDNKEELENLKHFTRPIENYTVI